MSERVRVTIVNHIAEVVLCRPEKMNALDQAGFDQMTSAAEQIKKDKSVRVVIIHAEGENFCSGADKSFLQGVAANADSFRKRALTFDEGQAANEFQKPVIEWVELDKPVLVCLQGVVYGAGMQIALAGDIRFAAPTTTMSLFEVHWGLVPDMGITQTLPKLVRSDVAMELVLTGRLVKAQEAAELGLLTRIDENPLSRARELAELIAEKSPDATKKGKQLLRDSYGLSRAEGLALEAQLQCELVGTPNQIEAAMANMEKRAAKFT